MIADAALALLSLIVGFLLGLNTEWHPITRKTWGEHMRSFGCLFSERAALKEPEEPRDVCGSPEEPEEPKESGSPEEPEEPKESGSPEEPEEPKESGSPEE